MIVTSVVLRMRSVNAIVVPMVFCHNSIVKRSRVTTKINSATASVTCLNVREVFFSFSTYCLNSDIYFVRQQVSEYPMQRMMLADVQATDK